MKIVFLNDAGKRVTDGSSIALMLLGAAQTWAMMIPERELTVRDWAMLSITVLGWVFKFVRIV